MAAANIKLVLSLTDNATAPLQRELFKTQQKIKAFASKVKGYAGAITGFLAGLAAYKLVGFMSQLGQMDVMLRNFTGSAELATQGFEQIVSVARQVPYSLQNITNAFTRLKIAGVGGAKDAVLSLSNALAAFGGTNEDLSSAVKAIEQMAGKGVVSLEELRGQLAERIPSAIRIMAQSMGMGVDELVKQISLGKVKAMPAIEALLEGFKRFYDGSAKAMANTYQGLLNQISTEYALLANKMRGTEIWIDLKAGLAVFKDYLKDLVSGSDISAVNSGVRKIEDIFWDFALGIAEVSDLVTPVIKGMWNLIEEAVKGYKGMPDVVKEVGLFGAVFGGKKMRLVLAGLGFMSSQIQNIRNIIDLFKVDPDVKNSMLNYANMEGGSDNVFTFYKRLSAIMRQHKASMEDESSTTEKTTDSLVGKVEALRASFEAHKTEIEATEDYVAASRKQVITDQAHIDLYSKMADMSKISQAAQDKLFEATATREQKAQKSIEEWRDTQVTALEEARDALIRFANTHKGVAEETFFEDLTVDFDTAMDSINNTYIKLTTDLNKNTEKVGVVWDHTFERMTDTLADFIKNGKFDFSNFFDWIKGSLAQVAATEMMGSFKSFFSPASSAAAGAAAAGNPDLKYNFDSSGLWQQGVGLVSNLTGIGSKAASGLASAVGYDVSASSISAAMTSWVPIIGWIYAAVEAGRSLASWNKSKGYNTLGFTTVSDVFSGDFFTDPVFQSAYGLAGMSDKSAGLAMDVAKRQGNWGMFFNRLPKFTQSTVTPIQSFLGDFFEEKNILGDVGKWVVDPIGSILKSIFGDGTKRSYLYRRYFTTFGAEGMDKEYTQSRREIGFPVEYEDLDKASESMSDQLVIFLDSLATQFDNILPGFRDSLLGKTFSWDLHWNAEDKKDFEDDTKINVMRFMQGAVKPLALEFTNALQTDFIDTLDLSIFTEDFKNNLESAIGGIFEGIDFSDVETVDDLQAKLDEINAKGEELQPYFEYIEQVKAITAQFDEAVKTHSLSEYALSLESINTQYEEYKAALGPLGVDISKLTSLTEAWQIAIEDLNQSYSDALMQRVGLEESHINTIGELNAKYAEYGVATTTTMEEWAQVVMDLINDPSLWQVVSELGVDPDELIADIGYVKDYETALYELSATAREATLSIIANIQALDAKLMGTSDSELLGAQLQSIGDKYGYEMPDTYEQFRADIISAYEIVPENFTDELWEDIYAAQQLYLAMDGVTEAATSAQAAIDGWARLHESISDQISGMLYSEDNPESAQGRLDALAEEYTRLTGGRTGEDLIGWLGGMDAETAQTTTAKIQELLSTSLGLSQEVYQRPSEEYQYVFDWILDELNLLDTFTGAKAGMPGVSTVNNSWEIHISIDGASDPEAIAAEVEASIARSIESGVLSSTIKEVVLYG